MLRWTSEYCKDVRLLVKVDDDSFIVPQRLVSAWLADAAVQDVSWPINSIIGERRQLKQ